MNIKYIYIYMLIYVKEEANFLNAITTYGSSDLDNIQSNVMTRSKNQIRNRLQKVLICYTMLYNFIILLLICNIYAFSSMIILLMLCQSYYHHINWSVKNRNLHVCIDCYIDSSIYEDLGRTW